VSGVRKLAVSLVIGATPVTWHGDWNLLGHSLSHEGSGVTYSPGLARVGDGL